MKLGGIALPTGYNAVNVHDTPLFEGGLLTYAEAQAHAQELLAHGVTGYKLLGNDKVQRARAYVEAGLLVFVRPATTDAGLWGDPPQRWVPPASVLQPYVDVGVQAVELGNEWTIAVEWKDGRVPPPAQAAPVVVDGWEVMLEAAQAAGTVALFPSASPGATRPYYVAVLAELKNRGLLDTVRHVAIHNRGHNNPPDAPFTDTNTITFNEWLWLQALFRAHYSNPWFWTTEHGTALNDSQYPNGIKVGIETWLHWNWQYWLMLNPEHPQAIGRKLAGLFFWHNGPFPKDLGSGWPADSLVNSRWPEAMPDPSPLWVRMAARREQLKFERYAR